MVKRTLTATLLAVVAVGEVSADELVWLDAYNVVWTAPSANSSESMPVGGHDLGLNVWVEAGELLIYVARAGCYDENGALLKLGRLRVNLAPNPFAGDGYFRQELKLREGCVEIRAGRGDTPEVTVRVWVEVHRPVAHVEIEGVEELTATATYESWRYQPMELRNDRSKYGRRGMVMMDYDQYAGEVVVHRDMIDPGEHGVVFYHRNRPGNVFDYQVQQQELEAVRDQLHDRLTNLTFGGRLGGDQLVADGTTEGAYANTPFRGWRYSTEAPARRHHLRVVTHLAKTETLDEWQHGLQTLSDAPDPSRDAAWQQNLSWWQSFWQRSRIVINPDQAGTDDVGWQVGRNYNVFRYMLASNRSGQGATPFNGGLFTFDPLHSRQRRHRIEGSGYSPDHRQWGAGLTQQNQRMIYWPMLKSGDFDLMAPGFSYYLDDNLINATVRVRHYWDHEGCAFAEQPSITGLPGAAMYGFHEGEGTARVRPGNVQPAEQSQAGRYADWWPGGLEPSVEANAAAGNLFDSQLDWAWMMLQYHRFTGDDLAPFLPFIEQAVLFYDEHYRFRHKQRTGEELDENGQLVIYPANTLEHHPAARNPSLPILGLHQILTRLLELPDEVSPPARKQRWRAILDRLPALPIVESGGRRILRPAENFSHRSWHMPEMYGLWPFEVYGPDLPDLELMRNTFLHGVSRGNRERVTAWTQGFIHYARLGMAANAQEKAVGKLRNGPYRFPTFWPEDIDWVPDHNWGGAGMVGLQEMLLQTHPPAPASLHGHVAGDRLRLGSDSEQLRLLPAWPHDWDVDFRLHAPRQTIVEGRVRDGQLVSWSVTPERRRGDVVTDRPARFE
ncbi:MAG: hypothetical protein EA424_19590 [Planctomycetaceae bacterium]|nr:MAG: hypothetical protein EA424_19590 [Planctomycetaceae bacterium]